MSAPDLHGIDLNTKKIRKLSKHRNYNIRNAFRWFALYRWREALGWLEYALKENPTDAGLYHRKGDCLYNLRRYKEALEAYEQAISFKSANRETKPSLSVCQNKKADTLEKIRQEEQAKTTKAVSSTVYTPNAKTASQLTGYCGPTDAQKAAAEWERKQKMANGQVSMPPDWHPPTYPDTGIPIGDMMMHGGQHFTPGHPKILGPGGQPFPPPFQPGPGHGGRH